MTIINNQKKKKADLALQLIAGTQKHLSNVASLMFGSGTATPAQVEAQLQLLSNLRADVDAAKAIVKAKLAAELAQAPALVAYENAYIAFVKATFGNSPDVLADFGIAPKKPRTPLTVAQKAAAKAKRDATRKARGTMGSKQKLAVVGDVTGVTITPTTASPAHSASAAVTAPAAPSATTSVTAAATTPSHGA